MDFSREEKEENGPRDAMFSFLPPAERGVWLETKLPVIGRLAYNAVRTIDRMKPNNNIRPHLLGHVVQGLKRSDIPEKLVSKDRFKYRVDPFVLEDKKSGAFFRLFYGSGLHSTRNSLRRKLQQQAICFWKDGGKTRASATEIMGKKGNKIPVYYYFEPHDVMLKEYQRYWAETGYKSIKNLREFQKIAPFFESSSLDHRLTLLREHRLMLRSVTALMKSKPRWVKYMGPRDFACTHCRRAEEFRLHGNKRLNGFHMECKVKGCIGGEQCEVVKKAVEAEMQHSAKDFEACYGCSRYLDCKNAHEGSKTHIDNVNRQRQDGFNKDRVRMQTDPSFAVIIADFSGLDKMFRKEQKTQGELRQKQLNILTIAVLTKNKPDVTPIEKHRYFDFIDERDLSDVVILKYALVHVLMFLLEHNFTKFSLWTDNCAKQFHSRKPLYAILVETLNKINNDRTLVFEFLKQFLGGNVKERVVEFAWNFFWPQHGKCLCNSHFAYIKSSMRDMANHSGTGGINTMEALKQISCDDKHIVVMVSIDESMEWIKQITNVHPIPIVKQHHCFVRDFTQGVSNIVCFPFTTDKADKTKGQTHTFVINLKSGKKDDELEEKEAEETVMGPTKFLGTFISSLFRAADSFLGEPVTQVSSRGKKAASNKGSSKKKSGDGMEKSKK